MYTRMPTIALKTGGLPVPDKGLYEEFIFLAKAGVGN